MRTHNTFVTAVPTPYMREAAAAAYLGFKSGRSLQNLRWKGGGPAFLKQGRSVMYRKQDLDEWLRQRAVVKTRTSDNGVPLAEAN